MEVAENLLLIK